MKTPSTALMQELSDDPNAPPPQAFLRETADVLDE